MQRYWKAENLKDWVQGCGLDFYGMKGKGKGRGVQRCLKNVLSRLPSFKMKIIASVSWYT